MIVSINCVLGLQIHISLNLCHSPSFFDIFHPQLQVVVDGKTNVNVEHLPFNKNSENFITGTNATETCRESF